MKLNLRMSATGAPLRYVLLTVIKQNELQKWETKIVVVIMTLSRANAISEKRELLPVL